MTTRRTALGSLMLLPLAPLCHGAAGAEAAVFEKHETPLPDGTGTLPWRLLRPEKVEPGAVYPLVFFLHGAGERGTDNAAQLRHFPELMARAPRRQQFPCFLAAPQCAPGKRWCEVDWAAPVSSPQPAQPGAMLAGAMAVLDALPGMAPVDRSRIYLTGLSMGGYGSWELAARRPETFAAVAPICGGGDEKQAPRLAKLPLWAWHGAADTVVLPGRTRSMIEAIKAAGGAPKHTELPGVAHNSWAPAYAEGSGLLEWMFQQRRT